MFLFQSKLRLRAVISFNKIYLIFILLGLLSLCSSCKKASFVAQPKIRMGSVLPLTGAQASFGLSAQKGILLAVEQINTNGGINGKQLEPIILDDQSKSEESAIATTRLISQEKVSVILGEIASSRSLAMAPIAQRSKVPMISPGSTHPQVTASGDYIFRVCFIDPFQGEVMAQFARKKLQLKQVALFVDMKSDYSVGLAEFFESTFRKEGGIIVTRQTYNSGDIDFKAQLTSIRSTSAEAIFLPGSYMEVGLIARQARELGIKIPFLGGDDWDSPQLTTISGNALENSYFSNHFSIDDTSPGVQKFIKEYQTQYNTVPDGLSVLGYDSVLLFADALKRSQNKDFQEIDLEKLRLALSQTQNLQGISGMISIDAQRNARKPAVLLKIKNGKFRYETTLMP